MIAINDNENQKVFSVKKRGNNPGDPSVSVTSNINTDLIKINKACTSYMNPSNDSTKVKLQVLVTKDSIILGQYVSEKADSVTGTYKEGVIYVYSKSFGQAFEMLAKVKIPLNKTAKFIDVQFETVEKDGSEYPVIIIYKTFVAAFDNECSDEPNSQINNEEG